MLDELNRRNVQDAEVYGPYYIVSYACHAFNIMNRRSNNPIFTHGGIVKSTRLPIIYMGPPGVGKTYYLEQMSDEKTGIIKNVHYAVKFEQQLSDAGLVGTVRPNAKGEIEYIEGLAEEYDDAIIMIDEFSAMAAAMVSPYNANMESNMLGALDSGRMNKRLASGEVEYVTDFTLWCGIQPVKCDLSGGLGRRLCILLNIPDKDTEIKYARASRKSDNIRVSAEDVETLHMRMKYWLNSFSLIKSIKFTEEFYDFIEFNLRAKNYIMELYKKIGIGYILARDGGSENIVIDLDEELKRILTNEHVWRTKVTQGPEIQQVLDIIIENGVKDEETGTYSLTKAMLNIYGAEMQLSASLLNKILKDIQTYGYIKVKNNVIFLDAEITEHYDKLLAMI